MNFLKHENNSKSVLESEAMANAASSAAVVDSQTNDSYKNKKSASLRTEALKSLVIWMLVAALLVIIGSQGTIAYFTSGDEALNTFTLGNVSISLDEPSWHDDSGENFKPGDSRAKDPTVTAMKGKSYMRVRVEIVDGQNEHITDEARLGLILDTLYHDSSYVFADGAAEYKYLNSSKKYSLAQLGELIDEGKIYKEYNKADFTFAGILDGNPAVRYYNYNGIFDGDTDPAQTATLFTNAIIPRDWHNDQVYILSGDVYETNENGAIEVLEKGTGYKVVLYAEAIQSAGMENADDAFAALDDALGITRDMSND